MSADDKRSEATREDALAMLAEVYKPEGVRIWLECSNRMLGGERGIDLLETDPQRVYDAALILAEGNFS